MKFKQSFYFLVVYYSLLFLLNLVVRIIDLIRFPLHSFVNFWDMQLVVLIFYLPLIYVFLMVFNLKNATKLWPLFSFVSRTFMMLLPSSVDGEEFWYIVSRAVFSFQNLIHDYLQMRLEGKKYLFILLYNITYSISQFIIMYLALMIYFKLHKNSNKGTVE